MEFRVLGPLEVRWGGRSIPLRPLERRILAALLTRPGRPLTADELIADLWPEGGDDRRNTLRVHVSHLKARLRPDPAGPSRLVSSTLGYAVSLDVDELDAARAERATRRAADLGDADPPGALAAARAALDAWSGTPFEGLDSPRVNEHRAHLDRLHRAAALRFAQLDSALSERPDLPRLRTLAAAEPASEPLAAAAALAAYRTGDAAGALAQLAGLRRRLAEDLGLHPGPAVAQLEVRILRDDPTLRLRGPATAWPAPGLDRNDWALRGVLAGLGAGGGRVAVAGARGMGKSALLAAVAEAVPAVLVRGRGGEPFGAARPLLALAGGVPAALDALTGARETRRLATLPDAAARLIAGALDARDRPVVLLDDADRLDPDSAAAFAALLADPRLRCVATAADLGAALGLLGAAGAPPEVVTLEALTEADCAALLVAAAPALPDDQRPAWAVELHRRSGGNPQLALLWSRAIARGGALDPAPRTVAEHARLLRADVAPEHRDVLDLAVADARPLDLALLGRCVGDPALAVEAAAALVALGLARPGAPTTLVPGVAEALRDELGPRLPGLHARLGAAALAGDPVDWDRALDHLTRAGAAAPPGLLPEATARAAAQRAEQGGLIAAEALYARALDLGSAAGLPAGTMLDWRLGRARALLRAGRVGAGCAEAGDAAAAARVLGDHTRFAEAAILAASPAHADAAARVEAESLLAQAADRSLHPELLLRVLEAHARSLVLGATPDAAAAGRLRARLVAALPDAAGASQALGRLALRELGLLAGSPAAERLALSEAAARTAGGGGSYPLLAALHARMSDAIEAHDAHAEAYTAEYARLARVLGEPFHEWLALRAAAAAHPLTPPTGADAERLDHLGALVDEPTRLLADRLAELVRLLASGRFADAAAALASWAAPASFFAPVDAIARLACLTRAGRVPAADAVRAAAADLTAHSFHLPGWAFACWCVPALDGAAADALARACRRRLAPHSGGEVVIDGGLARLGAVTDFLAHLAGYGQGPTRRPASEAISGTEGPSTFATSASPE